MIQGLIGKKLGMSQVFDDSGLAHPVTVLEVGPCVVTQIKTQERDGYSALQLGFGLDKRLNRPERGHRQASGFMSRTLREVDVDDASQYEVGQVVKADAFAEGDLIRHKKFGDGVVTRILDPKKVEILFKDEPRTLAQGLTD